MKEKGLVVVYDPHNLYQFVWYYCNKGRNKEWDALCLPNGFKGEYMHSYCEKTGIFRNIYRNNTDFSALSALQKMKTLVVMTGYYIMGRRTVYCKRMINQYVDINEYNELAVIADVGVISGACVALGKEKEVVIFEDGINDYGDRPKFITMEKIMSAYSWQGLLLSLLGYCSPGWFRLKTDQYCIKYCSHPEKMKYTEYKELRQLYSDEGTDLELFRNILRKIYPELNDYDFDNVDVILLTRSLNDFVMDVKKYKKRFEAYISKHYTSVLIKKHPREEDSYDFGDNVKVREIDNSIPAEALLPYLKGKDIVIITTSTVILYMKSFELKCKVVLFDGLYEESLKSNSKFRPLAEKAAIDFCSLYAENNAETIIL